MSGVETIPQNAPDSVQRVVQVLDRGGVCLLPTETVYGLIARVDCQPALQRIAALKGRPGGLAMPVVAADPEQALAVVEPWNTQQNVLIEHFWPGPLTLVCNSRMSKVQQVCAPDGSVGIRVPGLGWLREIAQACGSPLATTSANIHGEPAPINFPQGALMDVDLAVDGGPCSEGVPSSVVDVRAQLRVIREGTITTEQLLSVLKDAPP